MRNNIEPLAATLWFQRVAVVATGELGNIENSLRHAAHLVQLAPISFRRVMPTILDEDAFEALLESGNLDSAARQLFVPAMPLLVETSLAGEPARAEVDCPLLRRRVEGRGETPASAILCVWANWLVSLRLAYGTALDDQPGWPDGGAPRLDTGSSYPKPE